MRIASVVGVLAGLLLIAGIGLAVVTALPPGPIVGAAPSPTAPVATLPPVITASPPAPGETLPGEEPTPSITPPVSTPAPSTPVPSAGDPGPSVSPGASGSSPTPTAPVGLKIGEVAPTLEAGRHGGGDGDAFDLEDLRGGPVWVNFTAAWCPTCRDELALMQRFQQQFEGKMKVVVIDVPSGGATIEELAAQVAPSLELALDDGEAQRTWGAFALPTHYWIDADGVVRGFLFGGADPERFLEGVKTVIPDATFEP